MSWEPRGKTDTLVEEVREWPQLFTLSPQSPVSGSAWLAVSEPGPPPCLTAPWAESSGTQVRQPLRLTDTVQRAGRSEWHFLTAERFGSAQDPTGSHKGQPRPFQIDVSHAEETPTEGVPLRRTPRSRPLGPQHTLTLATIYVPQTMQRKTPVNL